LPAFNSERSHRDVGALIGQAFRRAGPGDSQPEDLALAGGQMGWATSLVVAAPSSWDEVIASSISKLSR
jgi:hypothetical protein